MSYQTRNPTIAFRTTAYNKGKMEKEARSKKMELSKYCAAIIEDYVQGRLVKEDQSSEMEKLRMEKLREEIRYLKIKNDFAENFDKPLSNSASRIIKPAITTNNEIINGVSPYDANNKRLQCTDCGVLLTWNSFETYLSQIKEYKNHIVSRHNRELSAIEKDVINNLKYEGKSK
tara:strand:+ start:802 stop:1323 length:522 start_codon:yes stop_codon:yes gene_type:complete